MAINKRKSKPKTLTAGRPPTLQRPKSIARKATKALINNHHLLEKRRQQAIAKGDKAAEAAIAADISALGGIETYQQASLQGQRTDRGGDSSRILMDWLKPVEDILRSRAIPRLRMLEVGALSTTNACSGSGCFDIERIDLNSQAEGILQQDFMKRPLPESDSDRFDVISLSLVLNFVPDPQGRGEMLKRTLQFLRKPAETQGGSASSDGYFPSLFLVLPAPCVSNSRYLDDAKLEEMMKSLGYAKIESKTTQRLVYGLWRRVTAQMDAKASFTKRELRRGGSRNNFSVVLTGPAG